MSGPWNGERKHSDAASGPVVTLDDREKLGPAEALLLEAADNRVAYHGTPADEVGAALLAQAREKLPEPELGTGGELIQQRQGRTRLRSAHSLRHALAQPSRQQLRVGHPA